VYLCNNFTSVIRSKPEIDARYLFWFLFNNHLTKNTLKYQNKTTGIINLQLERYIEELQIPLPPLPIQKRIAEILDAADALQRKDQALLKKYDELAQAIFIDMFGDPVKNLNNFEFVDLENICEEVVDCPHSTPIHSEEITNYPCIRTSEMKNGKIIWSKMKYLDYDNYLIRIKRLTPKAGDIVYAREGTYGEAVILPQGYKFALGQRTMLLRPISEKCDALFIWYFINSDFVYKQAQRKNMGSTVGHINVADVKKFQILLPPLELQKRFGDILKVTNEISKSINLNYFSEDLFNSLLQKAFKGELVAE
jgi:type I restriction enzyme S subunit